MSCVGLACPPGGGGGGGGGGDDGNDDCTMSKTVTDCDVYCSVTSMTSSLSTDCYSTACSTAVVSCDELGTTETSRTTTGKQ